MSTAPSFSRAVFVDRDSIRIFKAARGHWKLIAQDTAWQTKPSPEYAHELENENILIIVADEATGHVQFAQENQKKHLTPEAIAEQLRDTFQIDTDAYEFASQRFPLTRESVQVSVSGIERSLYLALSQWLSNYTVKKAWIMPFAWFVASLKSVEPVILVVVESTSRVHVSHHYLGIDDARVIALDELPTYVEARQAERKETHLAYVQASSKLLGKVTKAIEGEIAVQPLLEDSDTEPLLAVLEAGLEKGTITLGELLHFALDTQKDEVEELGVNEAAASESEDLPAPELPNTEEAEPEVSQEVAALPKPQPPMRVEVVTEEVAAEPESEDASVEVVVEAAVADEHAQKLAHLKGGTSMMDNTTRFVEVPKRKNWGAIFAVFVLAALLTSVVVGAVMWSQQGNGGPAPAPTPTATPTPVPSATPAPTPAPTVEKKGVSIVILNATGVSGLAGKSAATLTAAGWDKPGTGNATGSYSDATFIFTKKPELADAVAKDLGIKLSPLEKLDEAAAKTADVVIILSERP